MYIFIRYRIRLELFDGMDIAMFVLNDAVVSELVGLPCEKLFDFIEVIYTFHPVVLIFYV